MPKKPSLGRQKIKIAKIEAKSHLQVTFSKRRAGLFKKASELCTLCGAEIAIVVFSPAGKIFSFGHPDVRPVVDRFLARNPGDISYVTQRNTGGGGGGGSGCFELNLLHLDRILDEVEVERERGELLEKMRKSNESQYWWESPVEKLGLQELEQLRDAMEELRKNVGQMVMRVGGFDPYDGNTGYGAAAAAAANSTDMENVNQNMGFIHGFF